MYRMSELFNINCSKNKKHATQLDSNIGFSKYLQKNSVFSTEELVAINKSKCMDASHEPDVDCDKYQKIYPQKCHCCNPKSDDQSEKKECQTKSESSSDTDKCDEFDNRIKKIKTQLDELSNSTDSESDNIQCTSEKVYIDHLVKKCISDEEEESASKWDLCDYDNKTKQKCRYRCGNFAIDEDLSTFKKKVIQKAELIISCYKKKLAECEESKSSLEKCLHECKQKNANLENKLTECRDLLNCCESEKKAIMKKVKKYEKELAQLFDKLGQLENELIVKKEELDKCHGKNKHLYREIQSIKKQLESCVCEKAKLKENVDKLYDELRSCKYDKKQIIAVIAKLKEKNKKYEEQNAKLEYQVRELNEESIKLNNKVKLLICQNKELDEENTDLKNQLGKILETLKCLCDKYNALKEKCKKSSKY